VTTEIAALLHKARRGMDAAREHHKALIEAFELRQLADYSPGVGVREQRARRLVDQAAAFARDAEAYIRTQSE
jgi:hypothetical protein